MASEEDAEIDDIDEELARIERQIQELEEQAGEVPEPEAPDPEPEEASAPAPEEAFEGDPDVDLEPTALDRLKAKLGQLRERKEDDEKGEADDEAPEEDETEDDDEGSGLAFWRSSDDEDEDASEAEADAGEGEEDQAGTPDEEPVEAETDDGSSLAFWRSSDDEDEDASHAEPPDEEPDADEAETEDEGLLAGVVPSVGSDDAADAPAGDATPPTVRGAAEGPGPQPPTPPASGARTSPPDEPEPAADQGESARASALLARFQGGGDDDPGPAATDEEDEDDDRGGIVIIALVSLIVLAGLAAAAYVLLPGASGEELTANLQADAITDDSGRYIATTGEPLELDASGSQGSVERYVWSFGDDAEETTSGPTVGHTYAERGTYTVEVTLEGADGDATAQLEVVVVQAPEADAEVLLGGEPVAQPATIGNNVFVGDQVTLDGSASSADPEHTIRSYTWDVDGDGEPEATGREAQLGFEGVGAWAVNLTVRDDLGNEDQSTRIVHVSDRRVVEDTIGPSTTEAETANYTVPVDEARLQARPVQLDVNLTYTASSNETGGLPVQPEVDPDLDLNVTDPQGNVFEAEDDGGEGQESISLPAEDLTNLGDWTVTVRQDNQNAGTASEAEYELVVETVY